MSKDKIISYLKMLGIKTNLKGFDCLVETIYIYAYNPNLRLYEDIYKDVANKYNYRVQNVERNMRTVILALYDNSDNYIYDKLDCNISNITSCPTIKDFIIAVINNLNKK